MSEQSAGQNPGQGPGQNPPQGARPTPSAENGAGSVKSSAGASESRHGDGASTAGVRQKSSGVFILFICLILACAIGWLAWMQQQQDEAISRLSSQQSQLENERSATGSSLEILEDMVSTLQTALAETQAELQAQNEELQAVSDQLTNTRLRLQNVATGPDNRVWLLTEAEAMLRLAQQRLLVSRDTRTAIALMLASDEILRNIDDSTIFPVRDALARDLEALRAVPEIDVQGKYLRMSALVQRISTLRLRNGAEEQLAAGRQVQPDLEEENGMLDQLLARLSNMVTVRRLDEPLQGMISAEQGYYIRQNIRLLLEQAQLALWRGQEEIYTNNIDQALDYISRYFLADDAEYRNIVSALTELRDDPVTVQIPPASSALVAIRQVIAAYERGEQ